MIVKRMIDFKALNSGHDGGDQESEHRPEEVPETRAVARALDGVQEDEGPAARSYN